MSEEQLVRMGRTDLYRRGDTEIKDGRRVAKPGEDAVTVLTTTLSGSFSCAYQHEQALWYVTPDGAYVEGDIQSEGDLVAIDPAPKIEPWEFHEIPWDHWFTEHSDHDCCEAQRIDHVDQKNKIVFVNGQWSGMRKLLETRVHSPDPSLPFDQWQPCGKYS